MEIDWTTIRRNVKFKIDEIRKHIRDYDYSDTDNSIATDHRVMEYVQSELRKSKKKLFDITDVSFGRAIELSKDFQNLRDDIDIFLDEIKLRRCEWKDLDGEWVERIIKIDLTLIEGIKKLNETLDRILREVLDFKQIRIKDHTVVYEPDFWKTISKDYDGVKKQIHGLFMLFKEREAACNIRQLSLEKTMERIKEELR